MSTLGPHTKPEVNGFEGSGANFAPPKFNGKCTRLDNYQKLQFNLVLFKNRYCWKSSSGFMLVELEFHWETAL